jgi:release factor glutamine methyltransferase
VERTDINEENIDFFTVSYPISVSKVIDHIPEKEKGTMSAHVLDHEPSMALFVDDKDPIIFYKELINFAEHSLVKGGYLFFELHELFGNEVRDYLQLFGFENIEIRKDLQGKSRMLKAQKV